MSTVESSNKRFSIGRGKHRQGRGSRALDRHPLAGVELASTKWAVQETPLDPVNASMKRMDALSSARSEKTMS